MAAQGAERHRSLSRGPETGPGGRRASKKNTRRYKKSLTKEELKKFRSQMWLFRRRWPDLDVEAREKLTQLFDQIPILGEIYHRREELSAIFDNAENRAQAKLQIDAWCVEATASESDWGGIVNCFKRHEDGILAYFDERKSSGVVEGLNNKARVIQKRCYGLKTIASFWNRLLLETGNLVDRCLRTIDELRTIAHEIKACFCRNYT